MTCLGRGPDVLVETEKIRRVVLVLQGDQPPVRPGIVDRPDPLLPFVTQKVDV